MKAVFCLLALILAYGVQASFYRQFYKQAAEIVQAMTLDQKIGQTAQADGAALINGNITSNQTMIKYALGGIYIGDNLPDKQGNLLPFWSMKLEQLQKVYSQPTLQNWKKFIAKIDYELNITTKNNVTYTIKPVIGIDSTHGDQRITGNILFPHNIGLSCSNNPQNFYNMAFWTAKSMKRYGVNWAHAPTVAVSHNPQWGRYYETMGQDHDMIYNFAKAYTEGIQGPPGQFNGVLASVKHFFSDGATFYGANQGSAKVDSFKTFIEHNIQGFNASVKSGVSSVMPSYSSINFLPLHQGSYIQQILKDELDFDGFVISDDGALNFCAYQGIPTTMGHSGKNQSTATIMMSGVDMFMIESGGSLMDYLHNIKQGIENNTVTMDRLNDAVMRILAVKMAFGLANPKRAQGHQMKDLRSQQAHQLTMNEKKAQQPSNEYMDSLKAVHQSLVLLKNEQSMLPIQESKVQYIILAGQTLIHFQDQNKSRLFLNYDNIGMQCGGWSGKWQGFNGNAPWSGQNKQLSNASSILDALKLSHPKAKIIYPNYTDLTNVTAIEEERKTFLQQLNSLSSHFNQQNTLVIGVIGQQPYAQSGGDINIPYCQNPQLYEGKGCMWWPTFYSATKQPNTLELDYDSFDLLVIDKVKNVNNNIPLLTVLFSGRPMLINRALNQSQAFISAFLPGTSGGQGIVDAIFGQYAFRSDPKNDRVNSLSIDWPRDMESLKDFPHYAADGKVPRIPNPLFEAGYGLKSGRKGKLVQQEKQE